MKDCKIDKDFDTYTIVLMVIFYLQNNKYLPSIRYLQTINECTTKIESKIFISKAFSEKFSK